MQDLWKQNVIVDENLNHSLQTMQDEVGVPAQAFVDTESGACSLVVNGVGYAFDSTDAADDWLRTAVHQALSNPPADMDPMPEPNMTMGRAEPHVEAGTWQGDDHGADSMYCGGGNEHNQPGWWEDNFGPVHDGGCDETG